MPARKSFDSICFIAATLLCAMSVAIPATAAQTYPLAPKHPILNTYHGKTVSDDYQWLEDADQPEVKAWVAEENKLSREALDAIPGRESVKERIRSLVMSRSNSYYGMNMKGEKLFAIKSQPPKQQALLVTLASADEPTNEKVVLDPNVLAADGSIAIDFYEPSPDGRLVAVSLSEKGSEDGSVHVVDVATGKDVDVLIPRVQYPTAGGSVSWRNDSKGFTTRATRLRATVGRQICIFINRCTSISLVSRSIKTVTRLGRTSRALPRRPCMVPNPASNWPSSGTAMAVMSQFICNPMANGNAWRPLLMA